MNAFYQHHKDNIVFHYGCFDRILLHAFIPPFYQPERVKGFFDTCRGIYPVTKQVLRDIAAQYRNWIANRSKAWGVPVLEQPHQRRDDFIDPYFRRARPDRIVAIIKAREPANIVISIGSKKTKGYHLQLSVRWVQQFTFYINDRDFGRMFVRVCPYFPFSTRISLNQHHWLANPMSQLGIRFKQCGNSFIHCGDPDTLQRLADSLTPQHIRRCVYKWLNKLVLFFTPKEQHSGLRHQLFFSQVEYCDNLIFHRRASLDRLGQRLLDANREIGQPDKLTVIFGRRIHRTHSGKLKSCIDDMKLANPVIRSHYKNGFIKQYVRDHRLLRAEATTNDLRDYGIRKAVEHLPTVRNTMKAITTNYLNVQQDILESFIDRGQLQQLLQPSISPSGKRIPGLRPTHPRLLALMKALVRFSHVPAQGTFATTELRPHVLRALDCPPEQLSLASIRYELSKLRAKGLVVKIPHSNRYRLSPCGYRLCVLWLKLFHKIYAPLTSAIIKPFSADTELAAEKNTPLDQLYLSVDKALDHLFAGVGLKVAA